MRLLLQAHMKKLLFIVVTIFAYSLVVSQPVRYTVANAHAHNDYLHPIPFYTAYNAGFGSVEADVFPVNGTLMVSHSKEAIRQGRTLDSLYLHPLLTEMKKNKNRKLFLLIDIKEDYKKSLQLLIDELKPLRRYLYSEKNKNHPITILISGERPSPSEYKNYPSYIFFDDDLRKKHTEVKWERVGLVSLSFRRYSQWNGKENISTKDWDTLKFTVDSVHHAGKKIRFWAAPDNENSWELQIKLGVDLIGTDNIPGLAAFLSKEEN